MNYILVLLILFFLLCPGIILWTCQKFSWAQKIGPVIFAYALGLIFGNLGLLPTMNEFLTDFLIMHPKTDIQDIVELQNQGLIAEKQVFAFQIYQLKDQLMSVSVLLAIPLMLFSSNTKAWKKLAGPTIASLFIGLFSVLFMVSLGYLLFKNGNLNDVWKISGLLVGVYTGGTPNLASLKLMLEVDPNTYILTHTYDLVVSVVYLLFLLTIGKSFFRKFLPFQELAPEPSKNEIQEIPTKKHKTTIQKGIEILKGISISLVIIGISLGFASLLPEHLLMVVVILSITTLGILASLVPRINAMALTFDTGMYFILIFSVIVASMADISNFSGIDPYLFGYINLAVFGSLALHVFLSKVFKVDADTTLITSVSFICSPPFVPVIAGALGNKNIILSGITVGIIGYALGNYLGFFLANLLKMF
jgi:uncharacterized membrane protein